MPNEWEAGKGQAHDIFKALILYSDHVVNEKKIFQNWIVIVKVAICGKMSLYPKVRGGPPSYAKIWQLMSGTPGLISFGVTSIIFILSPDQEFSGNGVGAISSISYHSIFKTVKKIFILKCAHQCIKSVVEKINGYVFDGIVKTQPSDDTSCTVEHVTKSLDCIMAALDASDSDDSDSNQSNKELEYVDLPANKDMHHSTAAAAVTIAPAAVTIAPLAPSPSVSAAVAAPDRPTVTLDA
ncbi:hypothetical protein BDR03DRAFT_1013694 [Suillus americanus]|nr:hypothetical protein BDR03DRAFT_1013694 [Suillus americanus]